MSMHTDRQPKPVRTENSVEVLPIFQAIMTEQFSTGSDLAADMLVQGVTERIEMGNATYGQPLMTDDGRDNLLDWWQEATDQVSYAFKAYIEDGDETGAVSDDIESLVAMGLAFALNLAAYIRKVKGI